MSLFADIKAYEDKRSEALTPKVTGDTGLDTFKSKLADIAKSSTTDIKPTRVKPTGVIGPEIDSSGLSYKQRKTQKRNLKEPEFVRAVARGVQQAQGMGFGAFGLAAKAVGAEKTATKAFKGYQRNIQEAKLYPSKAKEFTSIVSDFKKRGVAGSISDLHTFAMSTLGEMAPAAAETALSTLIGAALGTAAVPGAGTVGGAIAGATGRKALKATLGKMVDAQIKRGVKKGIYRGMTKEAMESAASRSVGASIALVASSGAKESGSMFMTDAERRGIEDANPFSAAMLGTLSGATELFSPLGILAKKFAKVPTGIPKKLTGEAYNETIKGIKNFLKRAGVAIPKSAGAEGIQEVVQEFLSIANERITGAEAPADWKETAKRFINTFAAGAVGGTAFGTIGARADLQQIKVEEEGIKPEVEEGKTQYDIEVLADIRKKVSANENKYKSLEVHLKRKPDDVAAQAQLEDLNTQRDGLLIQLREQVEAKKIEDDASELEKAAFGDSVKLAEPDKPKIMLALRQGTLTKEQWDKADKKEFTTEEIKDISDDIKDKEDSKFIDEINKTGEIPKAEEPIKRIPPKELAPGEVPVEDIADVQLVSELQEGVNTQSKDSNVYSESDITISEKRSEQDHVADAIATLFGVRIVRFRENNEGAMPINGGFSPANPNVLFMNENNDKTAQWVLGHEFTHSLKNSDPDAFNTLMTVAQEGMSKEAKSKYEQKLRDAYKREGQGAATVAVEEEMLADFVGDQFNSMKFWDNLHSSDPTHFEKVLSALKEIIDKIISNKNVIGNDIISKDFFNNIDNLQSTLTNVTRAYIGEIGAVEHMQSKLGIEATTIDKIGDRYSNFIVGEGASIGIREDENAIYIDRYAYEPDETEFTKALIQLLSYARDAKKKVIAIGTGDSHPFFVERMLFTGMGNNSYFFPQSSMNRGGVKGGAVISHIRVIEGKEPDITILPTADVSMRIRGQVQMMPGFVKEAEKEWKSARKQYREVKRRYKESESDVDFAKMVELRNITRDLKDVFDAAIAESRGLIERPEIDADAETKRIVDAGGTIDPNVAIEAKTAYDEAKNKFDTLVREKADEGDIATADELATEAEYQMQQARANVDYFYASEKEAGVEVEEPTTDPIADKLHRLAFVLNRVDSFRENAFDSLEEYDDYIYIKTRLREETDPERIDMLRGRIQMMEDDGVRTRHRKDARVVDILHKETDQLETDLIEMTGRTPEQISKDAQEEYDKREKEAEELEAKVDLDAKARLAEQGLTPEQAEVALPVAAPTPPTAAPVPEAPAAPTAKKKPKPKLKVTQVFLDLEKGPGPKEIPQGLEEYNKTIQDVVSTINHIKDLRKLNSARATKKIESLSNRIRLLREQAERQIVEGELEGLSVNDSINISMEVKEKVPGFKPVMVKSAATATSPVEGEKEDSKPRFIPKKARKKELEELVEEQMADINSTIRDSLGRPEDEVNLEEQLEALYDELTTTENEGKSLAIENKISAIEDEINEQEAEKPVFKFSRKDNAYGLDVKDPNPDVESRMISAKLNPDTWMDRVKRKADEIFKKSTSAHAELRPGKFGQLKNWLRLLKNTSRQGAYKAWDTVYTNVKGLDTAEREVFSRVLVLTDILRDAQLDKNGESLLDDGWLPFNFNTIAEVKDSLRHFQGQARKSPRLMKALATRRSQLKIVQEELVDLGLLPERVLTDQNYFHHQVLEHMAREDTFIMFNQQQSVRNQRKSSFKARQGSLEDYNTEYLSSEYEMLSQAHEAIAAKKIKMDIRRKYDIFPSVVAKAKAEADKWGLGKVDWQATLKETPGFSVFKPDPNMNWGMIHTVPEKTIKKILENEKITFDDLILGTVRRPDETWIVPNEVADTLKKLQVPVAETGGLEGISRSFINTWKKWTLMNPFRFFRYSTNNMSGDLDAVVAYDHRIMKYTRQAFSDVRADTKNIGAKAFSSEKGAKGVSPELHEELKLAYEHDVIGSGFVLHEVQDIDSDFRAIMEGPKPGAINKVTRPFAWWMDNTRALNNMRENTLRLAAFRYFRDRIESGEKAIYGASNPADIDDIVDPIEKAAKLSRELLGDYGRLTETGDYIRNNLIPFYSWMEINAPRYYRMMANAKAEGRDSKSIAKTISWQTAKKATGIAGRFMAFSATIALWNFTFFGDEERDLTPDQRRKMHILLGRNPDGSVRYLPISGAFRDALGWFGGEDLEYDIADVASGEIGPMKKVVEAGSSFSNRLVGGARPIVKTTGEALAGKSFYPDIWNPRPIYNKWDHIFRTFSLELITRRAMGIPTRGMQGDFTSRLWYNVDPGEAAYFQIRKKVNDFVKEEKGERPSHIPSTKSKALYYYKQSLRFSDLDLAGKHLERYYDLGGSIRGKKISLKLSEPTGGLPKDIRSKFYKTLTKEERRKLNEASKWYKKKFKSRSRLVKTP